MRISRWILLSAVVGLAVGGAGSLLGTRASTGIELVTTGVEPGPALERVQEKREPVFGPDGRQYKSLERDGDAKTSRPALVREAQARQPAPAAPSGSPYREETTSYDSWAVRCEDTAVGGATKRSCIATLSLRAQNQSMLLNWQIGFNEEGHYVTAVYVPSAMAIKEADKTVGGPILIANGVELKFGTGPARRLNYVWCGPRQCMAEAPIDEAFIKEALANVKGKASITVHTSGGAIPFEVPIKGIDKALSSTRR